MQRFLCALFVTVALSQTGFAQVTVHVLNPWRNDTCAGHRDSLIVEGFNNGSSSNSGWADRTMTQEGGNWFYFTYASRSNSFVLATYCGPATWQGWVFYKNKYNFNIDSLLLQFQTGTNELWITIGDSTQPPQVYDKPQTSKVIYIFNPWPDNSSQISIDDRPPMKMQSRTDICGWYTCYYVGPVDSLYNVYFTDYFHTQKYTSSGLASGTPIDLRAALNVKDTIYILPSPYPYGPPLLSATFPGQTGDCGLRKVSGIFRDWKFDANNPTPPIHSFFDDPTGAQYQVGHGGRGMVQTTLQPPYYIPQLTAAAIASDTCPPVSSWYQTYTWTNLNGRQNDTCIDLTLKKGDDGRWTFNSDDMGGFFPLDSFNDPNNIKYWDALDSTTPGAKKHNFHFSMEMHLQFVYYRGAGLVFDFTGDDDLWIFVNNRLAVDLGGLNNRVSDTFVVDKRNDSLGLGLVNGQTYNMDIFYAERNPIGSNLIIQTTMNLSNSSTLFYNATVLGPGKTQYLILEHVQSLQKTCGFTPLVNQIDTPTVKFFIQGPQFAQPQPLPTGSYYGGITVDVSKSIVTVDSAGIAGSGQLSPGQYRITFTSTVDTSRTGYLVFVVAALPPDHLDILPDSLAPDPKKDAPLDSVFIPMAQPTAQVYAVLRDKLGEYMSNASSETWTSRDTAVVTVAPSPIDKSRCVITKTGTGSTWVVVSQAGLKPDSVFVSAVALPNYPIISSAVMLDTNADIIPDMLSITLNDTFHTDQRLDSVVVSYRNGTYSIPASKTILRGKTLSVPFPGINSDAQPTGTVAIFMNISASEKSYSKAFIDGVDPAIIAANVMENEGGGPDTLFVTFSEPIQQSSLTGNQLLLIKASAIDTVSLNILQVITQSNDSIFTIQVTSSGLQPKAGDRLRLLPGSRNGKLIDQSKNTPHDLNRSVVLGLRLGPPAVIASYYRDGNADGFIDTVVMAFRRAVQASEIQMMSVKWTLPQNIRIDTVLLSALNKITDSSYCIPVHGETLMPKRVRTNVGMELFLAYTNFPDLPLHGVIVADSAAPVIDSVSLSPDQNCGNSDTLLVSFSEPPVLSSSTSPLIVLDKTANATRTPALYLLKVNGNNACFSVGGDAPHNGDVLWINPLDCVRDSGGAYQDNPDNRKTAIAVASPKGDWRDPFVNINPFAPGSAVDAADAPRGKGTFIAILPKCPNGTITISANIKIFDPLGNFIFENNQAVKYGNGYYIPWDGYTRSGRMAGTGVYEAVVTVSGGIGSTSIYTLRVGVKR